MRRRNRSTRPTSVNRKLFAANATLGYRVVRLITETSAEEMVKARQARRVYDGDVFRGYQICKPAGTAQLRESDASSAAFSRSEVDAIAGLHGESETEHLNEIERRRRVARGLRDMDLVESSRAKLAVYADVH